MRTVTLQSLLLRAWQRVGNDASTIDNVPTGARTMLVAAAKTWLESVMLGWAMDPTPKPQADFGALPNGVTFESASAEAVVGLQSS